MKSQVISYGDCSERMAETFYNMGRICFAKGELRKAIQLLRKVNTGWFCYIFSRAYKHNVRSDGCMYVQYVCVCVFSLPFPSLSFLPSFSFSFLCLKCSVLKILCFLRCAEGEHDIETFVVSMPEPVS